jgi:hypothetical protein
MNSKTSRRSASRSPRTRSPRTRSPRTRSPSRSPSTKRSPRASSKTVAKFLSTLFHSRTQAHILHLQTPSFAGHKALNSYYDAIVPLVDKYAESYQGKYGIVKGYLPMNKVIQGNQAIPYFDQLEKQISSMRNKLPRDLDLENAYADILDLIHSTQYLLKQLH